MSISYFFYFLIISWWEDFTYAIFSWITWRTLITIFNKTILSVARIIDFFLRGLVFYFLYVGVSLTRFLPISGDLWWHSYFEKSRMRDRIEKRGLKVTFAQHDVRLKWNGWGTDMGMGRNGPQDLQPRVATESLGDRAERKCFPKNSLPKVEAGLETLLMGAGHSNDTFQLLQLRYHPFGSPTCEDQNHPSSPADSPYCHDLTVSLASSM